MCNLAAKKDKQVPDNIRKALQVAEDKRTAQQTKAIQDYHINRQQENILDNDENSRGNDIKDKT